MAVLKGQSNEIFNLKFFSYVKLTWATDQWVKIFSILGLRICQFNQIFQSPRGMRPQQSMSPGYDTPASQSPRDMNPRQVNLPGVS